MTPRNGSDVGGRRAASIAPRAEVSRRRAVVLPVVLLVIALLAVIGAMFAFHVHADVASLRAVEARLQTRLAAEAGVEYVKLMLRTSRLDRARWYDNPEELNRVLVWGDGTAPQDWGLTRENKDLGVAYRFSIVADDPTDDEEFTRFGITDESSKLNLNKATSDQLNVLVRIATSGDSEIDPQAIVDAILDWRDADSDASGEEGDTEGDYYKELPRPYLVKNAAFDSVEELLLVKGVTESLLYGEDRDRNGLMTPNENDGDHLYPPDNADGVLDRGLYPYLTVHSVENNVGNDNRQRTYLYGPETEVREALASALEEHGDWVDFVIQTIKARPKDGKAPKPSGGQGGKPRGEQGQDHGGQGGAGGDGSPTGGQGSGADGGGTGKPGGSGGASGQPGGGTAGGKPSTGNSTGGVSPLTGDGGTGGPGMGSGAGTGNGAGGKPPGGKPPGSKPPKPPKPGGGSKPPTGQKAKAASAKLQHDPGATPQGGAGGPVLPPAGGTPKKGGSQPPKGGEGTPSTGGGDGSGGDADGGGVPSGGDADGDEGAVDEGEQGDSAGEGGKDGAGQESGGESGGVQPIRSPAAFFVEQQSDGGSARPSPIPVEYLAVMLDRFTAEPPTKQKIEALINVNTAPRPVLRTLPVLTEQQIDAILEVREGLSSETAATPAWLVTTGALDVNTFEKIAHFVTARGQQFMVESIGFADHTGMVTRLQVILDMMGPVAQTVYYRELSQLGGRFPIREEDQKRSRRGR